MRNETLLKRLISMSDEEVSQFISELRWKRKKYAEERNSKKPAAKKKRKIKEKAITLFDELNDIEREMILKEFS